MPDDRAGVEREPAGREPLRAVPALERELRDDEEEEALAFALALVSAWRSLSKSLSACLLVFAASRRSVRSAEVTSL